MCFLRFCFCFEELCGTETCFVRYCRIIERSMTCIRRILTPAFKYLFWRFNRITLGEISSSSPSRVSARMASIAWILFGSSLAERGLGAGMSRSRSTISSQRHRGLLSTVLISLPNSVSGLEALLSQLAPLSLSRLLPKGLSPGIIQVSLESSQTALPPCSTSSNKSAYCHLFA